MKSISAAFIVIHPTLVGVTVASLSPELFSPSSIPSKKHNPRFSLNQKTKNTSSKRYSYPGNTKSIQRYTNQETPCPPPVSHHLQPRAQYLGVETAFNQPVSHVENQKFAATIQPPPPHVPDAERDKSSLNASSSTPR